VKVLLSADPELPVPPRTYGGIERIVDSLARGLRRRGHEVALAAHADSTAPVERLFAWPGKASLNAAAAARNTLALRRAVRTFQPDLLHSFSRLLYLVPLLPRSLPKIMSYQRYPSRRTVAWAARLAQGTLHFTGCSDYISDLGRRAGGRWTSIHNCVELERYDFRPAVADDAPLVFLSRVEHIKGAHLAIEAARKSGQRLLLAGNHETTGENGRYWREEIAPHLGRDGIEYVGPVDDWQKNELLGRARAMIVPVQWDEPFGIVFAESLACGTPVISCPRGALPEIVREGREGFLCRTVEELVAAIASAQSLDRAGCRRRVEEAFSAEKIVDRYEKLYQHLVATRLPVAVESPALFADVE
jgi:glycosyltransferase involved in cell wall biosynthesis